MGILVEIFAISDVVVLCGSFVDGVGGHNPLESEFFHNKLITGQYIFNQQAIFNELDNVIYTTSDDLHKALEKAVGTDGVKIKHKPNLQTILKKLHDEIERK